MLKPYSTYKSTTLPYVDRIPSHWDIVRNEEILTEKKELSTTGKEQLLSLSQYTGIEPKIEVNENQKETNSKKKAGMKKAASLIGYKCVSKNDIVMNYMLAWNGSTATSNYDGVISPSYAVFKAKENVNPWYLHYLFRCPNITKYFETYSTGVISSRLRLYPNTLAQLNSILPPINEQNKIVEYLDNEVNNIDKLIQTKKKEIKLLEEIKQTIIYDIVTGKAEIQQSDKQ